MNSQATVHRSRHHFLIFFHQYPFAIKSRSFFNYYLALSKVFWQKALSYEKRAQKNVDEIDGRSHFIDHVVKFLRKTSK
jgi:hypothetical protein